MSDGILLYCRPGFEKECLAEVVDTAGESGCLGWANPDMNSGFLVFETTPTSKLIERLPELVFARDAWAISARLADLDERDRLTPIIEAVARILTDAGIRQVCDVSCEYADGEQYRPTGRFAGKFVHPLRQALRRSGWLTPKARADLPALRLFFKDSSQVLIGVDRPDCRAAWPMGIARLKFPAGAPSRSTLKLEEAFSVFLGPQWRDRLQDCHTGVDLGASPGGWTWQLVNQGMHVYAIDNGPMDEALMATTQVDHQQADGFLWKPDRYVDWVVCDMVEKPARVAFLMYEWLHERHARYAMFNLKLPMRKRFAQWQEIREFLETRIAQEHPKAELRAKHLYHDREEITVYLDLKNQNG